jgi:hypothetical protein
MKHILFIAVFIWHLPIYAQHWKWVDRIGLDGTGNDYGQDIKLDAQGNVYVCGRVKNATTFGWASTPVTPPLHGDQDAFIAKYNNNGQLIWVKRNGGVSHDYANGISIDNQNNLYVTGYFTGTINFEGNTYTSIGTSDFYVAKFDANGNLLWFKHGGNSGNTIIANAIAIYNDTIIYVCGTYSGAINFQLQTITSSGNDDIFLISLDSAGNLNWMKSAGSTGLDRCLSITTDNSGNAYICGDFSLTAYFDALSVTRTGSGFRDAYIAKYNPSGAAQWVRKVGSSQLDVANKIAYDKTGYIITTGYVRANTTFFDNTNQQSYLTHAGLEDIFLCKHDLNGNLQWGRGYGGTGFEQGGALWVNNNAEIFLTGEFSTPFLLDTIQLTPIGTRDLFFSKFNAAGNIIWSKQVDGYPGGGYFPVNNACYVDQHDYLYTTGGFKATSTFDTFILTASGSSEDAFLGKISPILNAQIYYSDTLICITDSVKLYFTGTHSITSHNWIINGANINNVADTAYVNFNTPGNYQILLEVSDGVDTLTLNNLVIQVVSTPQVFLGNDTTLCSGTTLNLDAGTGYDTYLWNTAATSANITITTAGTYSVQVSLGACINTDTINIQFYPAQNIHLGNDSTVCLEDNYTLSVSPDYISYLWNNTQTGNTVLVNQTGNYYVQVTDSNSCTHYSDTVYFIVNTCLGVYERQDNDNDLTVYPNPANNQVNILFEEVIQEIFITDILGNKVFSSGNKQNKNIIIDISDFAAGYYRVNIIMDGELISKPLIVAK